jgi:hypothetical protein
MEPLDGMMRKFQAILAAILVPQPQMFMMFVCWMQNVPHDAIPSYFSMKVYMVLSENGTNKT